MVIKLIKAFNVYLIMMSRIGGIILLFFVSFGLFSSAASAAPGSGAKIVVNIAADGDVAQADYLLKLREQPCFPGLFL